VEPCSVFTVSRPAVCNWTWRGLRATHRLGPLALSVLVLYGPPPLRSKFYVGAVMVFWRWPFDRVPRVVIAPQRAITESPCAFMFNACAGGEARWWSLQLIDWEEAERNLAPARNLWPKDTTSYYPSVTKEVCVCRILLLRLKIYEAAGASSLEYHVHSCGRSDDSDCSPPQQSGIVSRVGWLAVLAPLARVVAPGLGSGGAHTHTHARTWCWHGLINAARIQHHQCVRWLAPSCRHCN